VTSSAKSSRTASSFSTGRRSRLPLRALTRLSGMSGSRAEETADFVRMIKLINLNLNDAEASPTALNKRGDALASGAGGVLDGGRRKRGEVRTTSRSSSMRVCEP
jgi:hypothetical protein